MFFIIHNLPIMMTGYLLEVNESLQKDTLMNQKGEAIVEIGIVMLAVSLVVVTRLVSARMEHAILLAIFLSFGLVGFFLIK
jgi:hypothetical protein